MTKFVVRLSLIVMLLGALVAPALAHFGNSTLRPATASQLAAKTAGSPMLMADGPLPIPWPHVTDGLPIPWPHISAKASDKATGSPTLVADGYPIPWPTVNLIVSLVTL